ncbi:MAG: carbohydrate-binding protein [Comamonas sp.]|jgi:hypothetical protein|uniref:carbohydrate-binding protein n=1 Tax=Comamonas sp. TaxID=34028 RepID=UPI00281C3364|nr:carbohydrate-binding protein [Comamonas sp.]MDR0216206.1 carbohydrate-binding protein [Comamonas sp.]
MSLKVVKPTEVTPAMLDSSVPVDDYPAWEANATYAAEQRVVHAYQVWQSLQGANKGHGPDTDAAWWVLVGPVNRMQAFDLSHTTKTRFSGGAWFEIRPGAAINSLALLEFDGLRSVRIIQTHPAYGTLYDKKTMLWSHPNQSGWYPWTFGERTERNTFYALDLQSYRGCTIRIELESASDAGVGVILIGQQQEIGLGVLSGVSMGIRDYSRKEINQWGDVTLQKRAFSRARSIKVLCANDQIDNTDRLLSSLRATPLLWLVSDRREQVNVYGWYSDFSIAIEYARNSILSLQLEGLTE